MNRQQIEAVVISVLVAVLKCEITKESSRKNTPKWDSLKHIQVIFTVEDELGLRFLEETLAGLDSVDSIVKAALELHEA